MATTLPTGTGTRVTAPAVSTSASSTARFVLRRIGRTVLTIAVSAIILGILNDAWSDNWGFVPLTDAEIAYAGRKLKPIVFEDMIRIAELDGEPVAPEDPAGIPPATV